MVLLPGKTAVLAVGGNKEFNFELKEWVDLRPGLVTVNDEPIRVLEDKCFVETKEGPILANNYAKEYWRTHDFTEHGLLTVIESVHYYPLVFAKNGELLCPDAVPLATALHEEFNYNGPKGYLSIEPEYHQIYRGVSDYINWWRLDEQERKDITLHIRKLRWRKALQKNDIWSVGSYRPSKILLEQRARAYGREAKFYISRCPGLWEYYISMEGPYIPFVGQTEVILDGGFRVVVQKGHVMFIKRPRTILDTKRYIQRYAPVASLGVMQL